MWQASIVTAPKTKVTPINDRRSEDGLWMLDAVAVVGVRCLGCGWIGCRRLLSGCAVGRQSR
jgi:hypothetical protein